MFAFRVTISLIGGIQAPDYGNIICKVDVEFSNGEENMTISQVTNGISEIVQQYSGTEVLNGSGKYNHDFSLHSTVDFCKRHCLDTGPRCNMGMM